jgi:hypothetical protein
MNNYSYPANPYLPANVYDSEAYIINSSRLQISIDSFYAQYGKNKPLVIEYGFQTTIVPGQTAGLVADRATKEIALKATTRFYSQYENIRGTMYFGFNVIKEEGFPPRKIDWAL